MSLFSRRGPDAELDRLEADLLTSLDTRRAKLERMAGDTIGRHPWASILGAGAAGAIAGEAASRSDKGVVEHVRRSAAWIPTLTRLLGGGVL